MSDSKKENFSAEMAENELIWYREKFPFVNNALIRPLVVVVPCLISAVISYRTQNP